MPNDDRFELRIRPATRDEASTTAGVFHYLVTPRTGEPHDLDVWVVDEGTSDHSNPIFIIIVFGRKQHLFSCARTHEGMGHGPLIAEAFWDFMAELVKHQSEWSDPRVTALAACIPEDGEGITP